MGNVGAHMRDLRSWAWQSKSHLSWNQTLLCSWWNSWDRGNSHPAVRWGIHTYFEWYCGFDHHSLPVYQRESADCPALYHVHRRKHRPFRSAAFERITRRTARFRGSEAITAHRSDGNNLRSAASFRQQNQKRGRATWVDGGATFHLVDHEFQDENGRAAGANQRRVVMKDWMIDAGGYQHRAGRESEGIGKGSRRVA